MYILKALPPVFFLSCYLILQPGPTFSQNPGQGPRLNISCSPSSSCAEGANCINEECACPFPSHQFVVGDPSLEWSCVSWIGGPCLEEVDGTPHSYDCVDHASCSNSSGVSECTCLPGYRGDGRICLGDYGQTCIAKEDCLTNLQCWEGKCTCKDLEEFNPQTKRCLGLVGVLCPTSSTDCVPNAECEYHPEDGWLPKRSCRCGYGYEPDSARHCIPRK